MKTTMEFENFYLAKLFQETGEDTSALEKVSAARNSLVRLHNEGIKSLSNSSTCNILDHRLTEYSQLNYDDSKEGAMNSTLSNINNLLRGKVQTRHCVNWQSKLRSPKIDPKSIFIKSIGESGHCYASTSLPCQANNVSEKDVIKLMKKPMIMPKINEYKTEVDNLVTKNPILSTSVNPETSASASYKPKVPRTTSKHQEALENIENTFQAFERKIPVITNQHQTFLNSNKINFMNSCNEQNSNHSKNKNPYDNNYKTNLQSIVNNGHHNLWAKRQYINGNLQKDEADNQMNDSFRTARTELQIQNKNKYGNAKQNTPELNTVVKRSLGTTRSSVQNKFIPPFSASPETKPPESVGGEIEDERLKHIDPKMIEFIRSEIIDSSAPIEWDDIAGLEFAKSAIQEAVVWPLLRPDIFTGLRRPPRGILLFGPPGTGKTLIGKCIASQCRATFFSISASSLTSKWIGDGEKMVRALFAVAKCHQPAVVFIDEIDSLLTQRSDTEHEATRRIKTEFLVQLDGATTGDEDRFLVIGATNRPQELDEAARRRLVKRLYIPLPDINARQQIIQRLMSTERNSLTQLDVERISQMTDGYSGADMRSLCSEAALGPIRSVPLSQITNIQCDQVRPVNAEDFEKALTRVRPSVSSSDLQHYTIWDKTYGSGSAGH